MRRPHIFVDLGREIGPYSHYCREIGPYSHYWGWLESCMLLRSYLAVEKRQQAP